MTTPTLACAAWSPSTDRGSITGMITRRFHAMRQRRFERRDLGTLRGLNSHTLKDIGLHRSEITSVVCVEQSDRRHGYAGN